MSATESSRSKEQVSVPEIDTIEQPMRTILRELEPNLFNNTYGLIVGDDTGGTYPTEIVNYVANRLNSELGRDPVLCLFLQGSWLEDDVPLIIQQMQKKKSLWQRRSPGKKALIVTERIGSGKSIRSLQYVLGQENIFSDVATITTFRDGDDYSFDGSLYIGDPDRSKEPPLYDKEYLTGKYRVKFLKDRFIGVQNRVVIDQKARIIPHKAHIATGRLADKLYQEMFEPTVESLLSNPEQQA